MARAHTEFPPEVPDSAACNDEDREAAVERAIAAAAAERISFDDYRHRLDLIWAAETHGELRATVADLPEPAGSGTGRAAPRRGLSPAWRSYLAVMGLLVAIWFFTTPTGYFWPAWPAIGWGGSLLLHCGRRAPGRRGVPL